MRIKHKETTKAPPLAPPYYSGMRDVLFICLYALKGY